MYNKKKNVQHDKCNELFLCKKMHLKWRGRYNCQSPSLIFHAQPTFPLIEKGPGGSISQVVGLPITKTACVHARLCRLQKRGALGAASDKVYQLLVHGQWFSPGTLASSITKTGHHDIAEILLEVALSTVCSGYSMYSKYTLSVGIFDWTHMLATSLLL